MLLESLGFWLLCHLFVKSETFKTQETGSSVYRFWHHYSDIFTIYGSRKKQVPAPHKSPESSCRLHPNEVLNIVPSGTRAVLRWLHFNMLLNWQQRLTRCTSQVKWSLLSFIWKGRKRQTFLFLCQVIYLMTVQPNFGHCGKLWQMDCSNCDKMILKG